jgi:hypothetical protein
MRRSIIRTGFAGTIAAALAGIAIAGLGVAPAFAATGPGVSVPVSAQIGTSAGFATLPGPVDFGNALLGGDTVVAQAINLAGNFTSYTLDVSAGSGSMTDGNSDTIPNAAVYWFPASFSSMTGVAGGWQAFDGTEHIWGTNPAAPTAQPTAGSANAPNPESAGVMSGTGVGTINADWDLRLPLAQHAGSYSETFMYTLTAH